MARDAEVHAPGHEAAHVGELLPHFLVAPADLPGAEQIALPRLRRDEAGGAPRKKRRAQFFLHPAERLTERRLGEEELPRSGGYGALRGDGLDVQQFFVGHAASLPSGSE